MTAVTAAERYKRAEAAREAASKNVDAAREARLAAEVRWLDALRAESSAIEELFAAHEALRCSETLP